jgi:3-isopropylmalate dehydratase small subunit
MNKFKNKLIYDSATGAIKDDRKVMTMLEDFWLPRREGGKGTEITTLPGGQNLGQIDDITYFQKNLYKSLNVPISRLDSEQNFNLGRSSEISRDELEFSKFITRLRASFAQLFVKTLGTQLMLKNIVTPEDWEQIKGKIRFNFNKDNFYEELKETEILRERITMLQQIDDYAGKYYSHEWVRTKVLRQTEEEIKEEDKKIAKEVDVAQYQSVENAAPGTDAGGDGQMDQPPTPGTPVGPDR